MQKWRCHILISDFKSLSQSLYFFSYNQFQTSLTNSMTDAHSLQKQYMNLKQKITERVKFLETELYDPNQTIHTVLAQSSCPSSRKLNHYHTNTNYHIQSLNKSHSVNNSNKSFEYYKAVKNQFSEILEENLRVQRQISSSLNKINENLIKQMEKSSNASEAKCNCKAHECLSNQNQERDKSFVNVRTLNINSLRNHGSNSKLYSINTRIRQEKRGPDNAKSKSKNNKRTSKQSSNRYNTEYFNLDLSTGQQFHSCTRQKSKNSSTKNRKSEKSSKKMFGNQKARQKSQIASNTTKLENRKEILGDVAKNFFENYGKG